MIIVVIVVIMMIIMIMMLLLYHHMIIMMTTNDKIPAELWRSSWSLPHKQASPGRWSLCPGSTIIPVMNWASYFRALTFVLTCTCVPLLHKTDIALLSPYFECTHILLWNPHWTTLISIFWMHNCPNTYFITHEMMLLALITITMTQITIVNV